MGARGRPRARSRAGARVPLRRRARWRSLVRALRGAAATEARGRARGRAGRRAQRRACHARDGQRGAHHLHAAGRGAARADELLRGRRHLRKLPVWAAWRGAAGGGAQVQLARKEAAQAAALPAPAQAKGAVRVGGVGAHVRQHRLHRTRRAAAAAGAQRLAVLPQPGGGVHERGDTVQRVRRGRAADLLRRRRRLALSPCKFCLSVLPASSLFLVLFLSTVGAVFFLNCCEFPFLSSNLITANASNISQSP